MFCLNCLEENTYLVSCFVLECGKSYCEKCINNFNVLKINDNSCLCKDCLEEIPSLEEVEE